jgi:hypothetical protein
VRPEPGNLGPGGSGGGGDAEPVGKNRNVLAESYGLGGAAPIVPKDGRTDRPILRIEQQASVHLPRKSDCPHALQQTQMIGPQRPHRRIHRVPPARIVL